MKRHGMMIGAALLVLGGMASARDYAPYMSVGMGDVSGLSEKAVAEAGLKAVTLAFLGTDGHCSVGWRGLHKALPEDTPAGGGKRIAELVADLQKAGIEVVISFGGWLGADPAGHCETPEALQAVYQQVLDLYHVRALDFDIEGPVVTDIAAHHRRDQALMALKKAHPELTISYTLPVRPHGVPKGNGLEVLETARADGYSPDIVNFMTMDYFYDPGVPGGDMAKLSIRALDNAARQMTAMGITSKLGVIPMIGQNDNPFEIFSLADAKALRTYADSKPDIIRLAIWSVERDNGGCAGKREATDTCSGVEQAPWAYSTLFR
jgi:hypothetical protein